MEEQKQPKPFMTYEQLIHKLKDEKKLEINDTDYAIKLLKEHSYFALISGYKGPFKQKDGTYKFMFLYRISIRCICLMMP